MAYYYVSSVIGARTADTAYTTAQTGTFASLGDSNVYASMATATTAGFGAGDIMCMSDLHADIGTGNDVIFQGATKANVAPMYLVVDDDNCDTESQQATALITSIDDVLFYDQVIIRGIYAKSNDDITVGITGSLILEDSTLEVTGTADRLLSMQGESTSAILRNCELKGVAGSVCALSGGSTLKMYGGAVTGQTTAFFTSAFANGGGSILLQGVDLSAITGTLFLNIGGDGATEDKIDIRVHGCKLDGSVAYLNETLSNIGHTLLITNSASSAVLSEYQYWYEAMSGHVEDTTTIIRDETTAFPSGAKVALKCSTQSTCGRGNPFVFDFPTKYSELSTVTDTIRIYLSCSVALTDLDVQVDVDYPDATNPHLSNHQTNRSGDLNGVALTDDTGSTWKDGAGDLAGYNEYYIDIDTSGNGDDGVPHIQVSVSKTSLTTLYFDTSIGVV